jgi:hypothetical protein
VRMKLCVGARYPHSGWKFVLPRISLAYFVPGKAPSHCQPEKGQGAPLTQGNAVLSALWAGVWCNSLHPILGREVAQLGHLLNAVRYRPPGFFSGRRIRREPASASFQSVLE